MSQDNVLYAQSGGVTAVINATAYGVIDAARNAKGQVGKVYAAKNGIIGALQEELYDTSKERKSAIAALRHTPGGAFGSCRYKLKGLAHSRAQYERLIQVFRAHDIRYFLYNGGGDSADTCLKISGLSKAMGYPVQAIHLPKTVDNDLVGTDNCPGFGSVAKYVAVSTREASLDVASMCSTSTKVFILEVMGRHAGWIAAAGGLAGEDRDAPPQVILFPEVAFDRLAFLKRVDESVKRTGYCVVVASEGVRDKQGKFLADMGTRDAFGHVQLGGVAPFLANLVKSELGHKYHWALADYLQRSARHIASKSDVEQACAVGRAGIKLALQGVNARMVCIQRSSNAPYRWKLDSLPLSRVANREKKLPGKFIRKDGFGITPSCRRYLAPLVRGEDYPPYQDGLPMTAQLKLQLVPKQLPAFTQV